MICLCHECFLPRSRRAAIPRLFTFGWPKMNGVHFLPLIPSPHFPLAAPHLHVHFSQFLPKGIVLLLALLPLLVHLGAQRRVAIVHQFADLRHRRIGQYLYDRGDLRLKANTVRHHRQVCLPARARADVRGGRLRLRLLRVTGVNRSAHRCVTGDMQTAQGV